MAKKIIFFLIIFVFCALSTLAIEKLTMSYITDVNKDGEDELLVHDHYGGTAGFGKLKIYNSKGICIFAKRVQGDPYLWHPVKHIPYLNPEFFRDLDGDGIVEILIGHQSNYDNLSSVNQPWWFEIYKWNEKIYTEVSRTCLQ